MKNQFKNPINKLAIIFLLLMAMFVLGFGCNASDPLKGWNLCFSQDPAKLDKAIQADYKDYIQKVHPDEIVGNIALLEDGTGQHAVSIEIFIKGKNASWQYALIYDKENKRIKTIKYGYTRYQS
jgi:hypothetical protein